MITTKHLLYTDISGNQVNYQTYTYGTGPSRLYIQGGIHGGEVTYFIFQKLHKFLAQNEKKLKGTIMLAPLINPAAWHQRIYYYTVGKFDLYKGADWNRNYPGAETTLSARMSQIIFENAQKFDVLLDLHTARFSKPYTLFTDKRLMPLLKSFGIEYNYFVDMQSSNKSKYRGIFPPALIEKGKQAFICECGSHDAYEERNINTVFEAVLRLMDTLEVIPVQKEQKSTQKQFLFDHISILYAPHSGFAEYLVSPQSKFHKNDPLCKIYSSQNIAQIITIRAPYDGVLFELPKTHIVWVGDELFRLIKKNELTFL